MPSESLAGLRKLRGWTQAVAARMIGLHPVTLSRIESGIYNPSLRVLRQMAEAYGTSLETVVSLIPPSPPKKGKQ